MNTNAAKTLRCPACGEALTLCVSEGEGDRVIAGALTCPCGRSYEIKEGTANLVFPEAQPYDEEDANSYDAMIAFIAHLLRASEHEARSQATDLLDLRPGARVLEVACGPAPNVPHVLERIGPEGELWGLDISPEMLRVAREKLGDTEDRVELVLGNGEHLPFADGAFDALLHVGTLNRFGDVRQALAEMARVVRVGGKVVAGDEGLASWHRGSTYAAILSKFGGLFNGAPPIGALPPVARDVRVQWLLGDAYYLIDFRVGEGELELNLDTFLPGRSFSVRDVLDAQAKKGQWPG